jgi:hypothetical protein
MHLCLNFFSTQIKSKTNKVYYEKQKSKCQQERNPNVNATFPPSPSSHQLQENIIQDCCKACSCEKILESECAVHGQLTPGKHLSKLKHLSLSWDLVGVCKESMAIGGLYKDCVRTGQGLGKE